MHPPLAFLQKHIMTKQTLPTLIALVASFLLQGCASAPSRGSAPAHGEPLPPVAAEFRTVIRHDNRQETSQWRYWRSANRVQREDLQARTGEVWIRDGATLFHTLVFHEDRRGVEFEPADLQMTGETSSWEQQAKIVNPVPAEAASIHCRRPERRYCLRGIRRNDRWRALASSHAHGLHAAAEHRAASRQGRAARRTDRGSSSGTGAMVAPGCRWLRHGRLRRSRRP